MSASVCVCVTGWHFPIAFYERMSKLVGVDVFVVSHQPKHHIPDAIYDVIAEDHVLIYANYGYDWGCYQQFLETDIWRDYVYCVFMHDDVRILRDDFIDAAIALLSGDIVLVGNGRNSTRQDWAYHYPWLYAHASWIPSSRDFLYDTVRGSFFVMATTTIETMGQFEVMWDRFHLSMRFGNWSLGASSAKLHHLFGMPCFAFLSNVYLQSDYLLEDVRGGDGEPRQGRWETVVYKLHRKLCKTYAELYQADDLSVPQRWLQGWLRWIIRFMSDVPHGVRTP